MNFDLACILIFRDGTNDFDRHSVMGLHVNSLYDFTKCPLTQETHGVIWKEYMWQECG